MSENCLVNFGTIALAQAAHNGLRREYGNISLGRPAFLGDVALRRPEQQIISSNQVTAFVPLHEAAVRQVAPRRIVCDLVPLEIDAGTMQRSEEHTSELQS